MENVIGNKDKKHVALVKATMILELIRVGFTFGGVVFDKSIKGPVDFNMYILDRDAFGYEIKGREKQFCLYELNKGRSKKGIWYKYDQIRFTDTFFEILEDESEKSEQGEQIK